MIRQHDPGVDRNGVTCVRPAGRLAQCIVTARPDANQIMGENSPIGPVTRRSPKLDYLFSIRGAVSNVANRPLKENEVMRLLIVTAFAVVSFAATMTYEPSDANAVVCARGIYRAGCVGARGGVVVRRPYYRRRGVVIVR